MTDGGWVVTAGVLAAGGMFIGMGRWSAVRPQRLVSERLPQEEQRIQLERFERAARRSQVLGAMLVLIAVTAVLIAVT